MRYASPSGIAATYALAGTAWILTSDVVTGWLLPDPATQQEFQTIKGLVFIGVTTMLVYGLARRSIRNTELRQAEATLRSKEELLEAVLSGVGDAVVVVDPATRTITHCNPAAVQTFGYQASELIGQRTEILHVDRAACEAFGRSSERALEKGEVFRTEFRMKRKDGTVFPTDHTVATIHAALGWRRGVVSVVRDITDRRRVEETLRQTSEHISSVTATSPAILYTLRVEGGTFVSSWVSDNVAAILGYSPDEALQPGWWMTHLHPDDRTAALERSAAILEVDQLAHEYRFFRKDGRLVWIRDHIRVVRDLDGRASQIAGAWMDVTARRAVEDQLMQAQKMESVGRLAGGVAHDFNNLLTVITGTTDLMLQDVPEGDPRRADLEEVRRASERAAALTRQLLAFSRKQVFQPRVLNLNAVLADTEKMLRRLIGEDVDLSVVAADGLGNVRVDPAQIEQIILNLVVNSRDAMPHGGRLTIETANAVLDDAYARQHVGVSPGTYVMLAVSDTGVGMDDATRLQVFEPFFTTKGPGRGTGLGLSTVYGIVKQCGGSIFVYSEPGIGTTFKLFFPLVADPVSERRGAEATPPARGSETVLLVEDEASVRQLVRRTLESAGHTVIAAGTPLEAIAAAETHDGPIHLLLTDVVMPEMQGPELASRVVALRPDTKVLFMSGYTENAVLRQGVLRAGARLISKPFDVVSLNATVRQVLDG